MVQIIDPGIFIMSAPMDLSRKDAISILFSKLPVSLQKIPEKISSVVNTGDGQVALRYTEATHAPNMARHELIAKLISSCIGLAVSFTITYFGFKYLANILDPTRQEKKEAQKRVSFSSGSGSIRRS